MATDLPGIRARAEFDLQLFRQQEEIIKNALRSIATEMRAVPSARIRFDTKEIKQQAQQAAGEVQRSQESVVASAKKSAKEQSDAYIRELQRAANFAKRERKSEEEGIKALARAEATATQQRIAEMRKAATAQEQFAARQKKLRDEAIRDADRAAREEAGQQRRIARAEVGPAIAFGAGGLAIAAQLIEATKAAAEFQKAMSQVKAVLSPQELAQSGAALEALALSLGRAGLGFTATEAATALEAMTKAGISAVDQLSGAPSVLALAAAGNVSLGEAAEFAATAIQTFKLSGEDLARVANVLVGVANATTTDIDKLRQSFSQTAAVAALHNQTIESTATALGLMAQAGIRSSDAGTSLRVMMLRLQPETEKQIALFQRYGLMANGVNQFIDQSTGKFKDLSEVAEILSVALSGATDAQKEFALRTIFGQDAVRAAVVLTEAGAKGFEKLGQEITEQGDALRVASERQNNLIGDLKRLDAAVTEARINLGKGMEMNLRGPVQGLTQLLQTVNALSPEIKTATVVLAGATAAFLTVTGAVLAAQAAWTIAGVGLAALGISVGAVAAPVAALTAAVVLLGVAWVNNWGDIQGKTKTVADTVIELINTIINDLKSLRDLVARPFEKIEINIAFPEHISNIVKMMEDAGKKSGINFADAFKRTVISNLPAGSLAQFAHDALSGETDNRKKREAVERQIERESKIDSGQIESDTQRIGEELLKQAPAVAKAITDAAAEAFANLPQAVDAPSRAAARVAVQNIATEARAMFSAVFPEATSDVIEKMVTAVLLAGQDAVTPAAQTAADAYKSPWELALKALDDNAQKFGLALAAAGQNTEVIGILLQLEDATKRANDGLAKLTDQGLVAAFIAQQNLINGMDEGQAKWEAQIALADEVSAHFEAQAKTQKDAADQIKLANDIAATGADLYNKSLQELISSTYPALTAQERELVEIKLKEGESWQAAQIAISAVGGDLNKVTSAMGGTGQQASRLAADLKRIADTKDVVGNAFQIQTDRAREFFNTVKADLPPTTQAQLNYTDAVLGPNAAIVDAFNAIGVPLSKIPDFANDSASKIKELTDEFNFFKKAMDPVANAASITKARTEEFLNSVISDMPAAAQAQIQMVQAASGPLEALRETYRLLGIDISKIPDLANASATKIKQAQQQIEAVKFFRETGEFLPATRTQTAGDQFKEAAKSANADLTKAFAENAKSIAQAEKTYTDAVKAASKALVEAEQDFADTIAKIDADLAKANSDIDSQMAEAIASYEKTVAGFDRQEAKLFRDFDKDNAERARAFAEQQRENVENLASSIEDINKQASSAIFDAVQQQREQLAQVARQLAALRAQEQSALRQSSEQIQDLDARAAGAQTRDEQQAIIKERIRLQNQQGEAAIALQKQIQSGQADAHTEAEKQQRAIEKIFAESREQIAKLVKEFERQAIKDREAFERANKEAKEKLQEQLLDLRARRAEAEEQHQAQMRELQKRREEARKQAEEAKKKAQEQLEKAQEQHREAIAKAEEQKQESIREAAEALAAANTKHAEAMNAANEALQAARDQVLSLINLNEKVEETNSILEDIRQLRQPYVINLNNSNIEEGDVEFLQRAAEEARRMALEAIT